MTSTRLPEDGYVRLRQSLGDPKAAPPALPSSLDEALAGDKFE